MGAWNGRVSGIQTPIIHRSSDQGEPVLDERRREQDGEALLRKLRGRLAAGSMRLH